ncbi:hypothetical protein [Aureibacillus halotolerans]|uniref:Uncharacterized protein n=1 Tax=Aureibacillus halotolerans TaxID=1508390 RepID=A0A4R6U5P0_9BACI|nr:hypothetical protein [Aureibacillus halotolerans]TDQ40872.1 hypothetical protein EV213_105218 [Aureibacillus halotolerans]
MNFTGARMTAMESFLYILRAIFSAIEVLRDTYALFELNACQNTQ